MARTPKQQLAHWLAVWFGCGHVPIAPGTAGTVGAIPLYLLLRPHGLVPVAIAALVITAVGVWAASSVAEQTGKKDPQIVVIDEVAGVLITLLAAPFTVAGVITGFVLFRLCDQFKPFPARWAERNLPSGWGIMFDDVFAGVWGAGLLLALLRAGVLPPN